MIFPVKKYLRVWLIIVHIRNQKTVNFLMFVITPTRETDLCHILVNFQIQQEKGKENLSFWNTAIPPTMEYLLFLENY